MLHLLTETSIFVSLPNDSLCQLSGQPLTLLKPDNENMLDWLMRPAPDSLGKRTRSHITEAPAKREDSEDHSPKDTNEEPKQLKTKPK